MAALKEDLLADCVQPIGIKFFTEDSELKKMLSAGDCS